MMNLRDWAAACVAVVLVVGVAPDRAVANGVSTFHPEFDLNVAGTNNNGVSRQNVANIDDLLAEPLNGQTVSIAANFYDMKHIEIQLAPDTTLLLAELTLVLDGFGGNTAGFPVMTQLIDMNGTALRTTMNHSTSASASEFTYNAVFQLDDPEDGLVFHGVLFKDLQLPTAPGVSINQVNFRISATPGDTQDFSAGLITGVWTPIPTPAALPAGLLALGVLATRRRRR